MARFASLLVLVFGTYAYAKCPDGSVTSVVDVKLCCEFMAEAAAWMDAEMQCNKANGHLTSILDGFSNVSRITKLKRHSQPSMRSFVDANDIRTRAVWVWEDGSNLTYQNWALGEPTNRTGFDCGSVSLKDGAWRTVNCYRELPYICMLSPVSSACPPSPTCPAPRRVNYCDNGWTIFQDYCYKVGPGINQTFWDARTGCQEMDAELASIHSAEENDFVKALSRTGLPHNYLQQVWIGMVYDYVSGVWKWTDKSTAAFTYWAPGELDYDAGPTCLETHTGPNLACSS